MNPIIEQYPQVRRHLYLAQFIVAGLILLLGVGFASAGMDFPTWYVVVSAVASALWSYLGLQAATNTHAPNRNEHGDVSLIEILLLVLIVLVILAVLGVV